MDLDQIDMVIEMADTKEVNRYLADGWVLLGVTKGFTSGDDGDRAFFLYSLGNPRAEE